MLAGTESMKESRIDTAVKSGIRDIVTEVF
jgi:hypothetical protein